MPLPRKLNACLLFAVVICSAISLERITAHLPFRASDMSGHHPFNHPTISIELARTYSRVAAF
ncbi:hypothetical protein BKA61DRAFT_648764 [Leptodontidium sp. MPI-SDFR-AT-0119]|nr:hypothetical protein BKA61DRAFT_648764 [Leptodontidium sp. MPI-SDFR-AT-0119]